MAKSKINVVDELQHLRRNDVSKEEKERILKRAIAAYKMYRTRSENKASESNMYHRAVVWASNADSQKVRFAINQAETGKYPEGWI